MMLNGSNAFRINSSSSPSARSTFTPFGPICRPAPASSSLIGPFEDLHLKAALAQRHGGGEAADTGADNDDA